MKITIKSDKPVTSDECKALVDSLNDYYSTYGLRIKNMTWYVRLVDENGQLCDVYDENGNSESLIAHFGKYARRIKERLEKGTKDVTDAKPKKKSDSKSKNRSYNVFHSEDYDKEVRRKNRKEIIEAQLKKKYASASVGETSSETKTKDDC